jgi:hypothetical protein
MLEQEVAATGTLRQHAQIIVGAYPASAPTPPLRHSVSQDLLPAPKRRYVGPCDVTQPLHHPGPSRCFCLRHRSLAASAQRGRVFSGFHRRRFR